MATLSGNVAWVSAIQNQGTAEDCWTFAAATAMDSNLLMQGYLPSSAAAPAPEVSSWHLSTANGNPNQIIPAQAFGNSTNWGTTGEYPVLGYVTRGSGQWTIPGNPNPATHVTTFGGGPVSNTSNPLNVFPAVISNYAGNDADFTPNPITPLLPPVNQPSAWRVTNMSILDQGVPSNVALPTAGGTATIGGSKYLTYAYTQGAADPQVQAVKAAILAHGAVTTFMNADYHAFTTLGPGVSNNPTVNIQYVNPQIATGFSNHSVTIIGWDDTQAIASASGSTTGGWIVQNSWGTDGMGDAQGTTYGTFWASYDDAVIGRSGVASFELAPMTGWSQTVLQNELGPMAYADDFDVVAGSAYDKPGWIGSVTGMAPANASTVMSILSPGSTSQLLAGLGLATQIGGVSVNVSIYEWNAVAQAFGSLLQTSTFTSDSVGFFLGTLPSTLLLRAGESYAVELEYEQGGAPIVGAAPITIGGSGINGYLSVTPGLSYYLDGSNWVDMSTLAFTADSGPGDAQGGILFLKGYLSSVPEIDPAGMGSVMAIAGAALALLERRSGRRSRTA